MPRKLVISLLVGLVLTVISLVRISGPSYSANCPTVAACAKQGVNANWQWRGFPFNIALFTQPEFGKWKYERLHLEGAIADTLVYSMLAFGFLRLVGAKKIMSI